MWKRSRLAEADAAIATANVGGAPDEAPLSDDLEEAHRRRQRGVAPGQVHEARAQIVAENRHAPIIPSPGPVVSLYWGKTGPWWWGILAGMPRPRSERHAWEDERAELPAQSAALQHDLDATPIENTPRRDRLTWTIRRARLRMAELDARLGRTTRESAPS